MTKIDRMTLMAFVDGELDSATAAQVGRLLVEDVEAFKYVRSLYEMNDQLTSTRLPTPLTDSLLRQKIDEIETLESPRPAEENVINFPALRRTVKRSLPAIAASVLGLLVGLGMTGQFLDQQPPYSSALQTAYGPSSDIADNVNALRNTVLETQLSGHSGTWSNETGDYSAKLTPVRTMRDSNSQFCREYRLEETFNAQTHVVYGVSCREGKNDWQVRYVIQKAGA